MLEPLDDPQVIAVYGRQVPRADAPVDEIARLVRTFPSRSVRVSAGSTRPSDGTLLFLSNACAAIRRSAWEHVRFDESGSVEEQGWMEEQLTRGFSYAYAAGAGIYHSHHDSVTKFAYRLWEIHEKT